MKISVILPGAILTNISVNSGLDVPKQSQDSKAKVRGTKADDAAKIIMNGIEKKNLKDLLVQIRK